MAQLPGDARRNQYTATAAQTEFAYDFMVYDDDEIIVQQNDETLTLTTDYTVQDAGEEAGGTITLEEGATEDDIITITGNTMVERDTTFTTGGDFLASAINGEYNKLDNLVSELVSASENNFKLAVYNSEVSTAIPSPTANRALVWNAGGTALENSSSDPDELVAECEAQVTLAEAQVTLAEGHADDASGFSDDASGYADDASGYATAASGYADDASGYADDASDSADAAAASAASIGFDAVDSDVIPDTDSSRDLGSTAKRWDELFVDDVTVTTDVTVGNDLDVTNDMTVGNDLDVTGDVAAATFNGSALPTGSQIGEYMNSVAYNVDGGSLTASTWTKRGINTAHASNSISGASLSSSVITIPAGTYAYVLGTQNGNIAAIHRIRKTDGTAATLGASPLCFNSMWTEFSGIFEISEESDIEVQMYSSGTLADTAMGSPHGTANYGNNIYLKFTLVKVA